MSIHEARLTRCDRCNASTKFQVFVQEKHALNFCGHHHSENQEALQQIPGVNILELVEAEEPLPV